MDSEKNFSLEDLIDKGKNDGSITNEDLLDAIGGYQDFDMDQIDKIYETLEEEELLERGDRGTPPIMKIRMLLAYKDRLFEICRDWQVIRYEEYQATGSGANAVIYGLSRIDKNKDVNEQLLRLLRISAKQDTNVSAPFVFIDTKGLEFTVKEG